MQNKTCSNCSADMTCGSQEGNCWCMAYAMLPNIIEGQDCICEACLKEAIEGTTESSKKVPVEQEDDYYIENGLYVFTKWFHLKRGTCCKNGCRHCPYGFKK